MGWCVPPSPGPVVFAMAADVADAARRARPVERRGGKVTEHDLRLVLRLAKRAGALGVRVGGMTIMFARDAGKRSAQAAPTRRRLRQLGARRQRSLLGLRNLRDPRALPALRSLRLKLLRRRRTRDIVGAPTAFLSARRGSAERRRAASASPASCAVLPCRDCERAVLVLRAPTALRRLRWTRS